MNEINQDTMQVPAVFKSIAVFGVGPGLGQAIARRRQPLELLWTMHCTKGQPEATYPETLFDR